MAEQGVAVGGIDLALLAEQVLEFGEQALAGLLGELCIGLW